MNISKRDLKLILILLSILIFVIAYFAVYSSFNTKAEAVQAEIKTLQPSLAELENHYNNLGAYEQTIETDTRVIADELARYPNAVRSEDLIMYAVNLEDEVGLSVQTAAFSGPQPVMALKGMVDDGNGVVTAMPLMAYRNAMSISATLTYQQLKSMIDYVNYTKNTAKLNTVNVSFNAETGELLGTMILDRYFITGSDTTYHETEVPFTGLGTDNIFGTITTGTEAPAN